MRGNLFYKSIAQSPAILGTLYNQGVGKLMVILNPTLLVLMSLMNTIK